MHSSRVMLVGGRVPSDIPAGDYSLATFSVLAQSLEPACGLLGLILLHVRFHC